jgi:hypothetical protein
MLVLKLHLSPLPLAESRGQILPPSGSPSVSSMSTSGILSMQPKPVKTIFNRIPNGSGWATSISRLFRPEDVPHCRLCTTCSADRETGMCLNTFLEFVPYDQIPMKASPKLDPPTR